MSQLISKLSTRGKSIGQMLLIFPLFLFGSIFPWLIVVGASLLSDWLYSIGWWPLGAAFRIVEAVLGLALIFGTAVFFFYWLVQVGRAVLGLHNDEG